MTKEEFYFDSRDGETRIHAIKWIPDAKPVCILQIVHGMAEYSARYERLAEVLAKEGILVAAQDHLGHGLSVSDKNGKADHPLGFFCSHDPATVVIRDVHRLKKTVQEQYPGIPYLILGHSMGSFMLRNYLQRYGSGIDGAIIMGTGMMPQMAVKFAGLLSKLLGLVQGEKHKSAFLDKMAFGSYNKQIADPATEKDWLSRDEQEVQKYIADPLCGFTFTINGFATLFELMDRLYKKEDLQKMPKELPVLFLSGDKDPVGDYGKAVERVAAEFQKLGMQRVECKLYSGMRHEVLNEIGREEVEADILSWIKKIVE
ncbi:MAG: alpha/beta hydrolase [Lachnospiraceae bacterium]|nr:alpha/beta hydrolase [Lachnospiraceae bacterium]